MKLIKIQERLFIIQRQNPLQMPATLRWAFASALLLNLTFLSIFSPALGQLRGQKKAVDLVHQMLRTIGGRDVWENARTINIRLRGHYAKEPEPWMEIFWIDLEEPRGRYEITSDSSRRVIAWTTAGGWEDRNGAVEPYSEERLELDKNYWQREPNVIFHRLAKGVPATLVGLDSTDAELRRITIIDAAKNDTLCWFAVNPKSEPVKWSTYINNNLFEHVLGPLGDYDDIRLPKWGATIGGVWRYEHLQVALSPDPPPVSFEPPDKND